jgi:hypothetical protein
MFVFLTPLTIREALETVEGLRSQHLRSADLAIAVRSVKRLQSQRFAKQYGDILASDDLGSAARFFLTELYSDRDFSERDRQFARIAPTLERVFPRPVIATATALAQLHCLTEQLDDAMARQWMPRAESDAQIYVRSWRSVGAQDARQQQLMAVLQIGQQLQHLTRIPGLRMMLRMMRNPASAAGLGHLQDFLELGFDTFLDLGRSSRGTAFFLRLIENREAQWIQQLFEQDPDLCAAELE